MPLPGYRNENTTVSSPITRCPGPTGWICSRLSVPGTRISRSSFLPGRGREEIVIEAIDAGATYYIQKGGDATPQFYELGHKITSAVELRNVGMALKASEERYRSIVEDQIELICRFGSDGIIGFCKRGILPLF